MSSRIQEQLPVLLGLARDRSEGARMQLAGMLADMFLVDGVALNAREEQLVNELLDSLLKTKDSNVRHELIKKFSDAIQMPRNMAVRFASDDIDVARAVLLTNDSLTEEDLTNVIQTQSADHACAIAARRAVSEAVADALITTGDIRVMQLVAENLGAKLSSYALGLLAEASRVTMSLHKPLMERPELTPDMASRLYWIISQDLRRLTLQRFGVALGQLDTALANTIDEKLNENLLIKNDEVAMISLAEWLEERMAIAPKLLPQILRLGHFRLFNIVLSRLGNLSLTLVDIIVAEAGGRTLAALCRAINIDKANFVSIFLLSRGARVDDQIVHPRELSLALAAYDRLPVDVAKDLLASWRENPNYILRRYESQVALEA